MPALLDGARTPRSRAGFFQSASSILRAGFEAGVAIAFLTERCAKGQSVAAVPAILDQRVDRAAHAGATTAPPASSHFCAVPVWPKRTSLDRSRPAESM